MMERDTFEPQEPVRAKTWCQRNALAVILTRQMSYGPSLSPSCRTQSTEMESMRRVNLTTPLLTSILQKFLKKVKLRELPTIG